MNIQLMDRISPVSVWQLLYEIDAIFDQPLPLAKQLEAVNEILIEILAVEAVWCVTVCPLRPVSSGIVHTPLRVAPEAKIYLIDEDPPLQTNRRDTLVGRALAFKSPCFLRPHLAQPHKIGADLADTLFNTFEISPLAVTPLLANHTVLGLLVIGSRYQTFLPEETQNLLVYLGKFLARNLQVIYLKERSQQHTGMLLTLNQIARTITSSLDIDDVVQRTMAGINAILDVEAGSLLLLDEENDELYFKVTLRGENRQVTSYRLQRGEGIAGWVVENNQPALVNHTALDERFSPKIDQAIGFTTKSVLCVPLVIQGKPIGALEVINKKSGEFTEDDENLLISMVASLSVAIKNTALYDDAQKRAYKHELISQITAAINAGHGLPETARIIFEQSKQLFEFDHMSISLLDDSKEKIRQWIFGDFGCMEQINQLPLKDSGLAQIMMTGQGYIEADISRPKSRDHIYPDDEILLIDTVRAKATVPLISKNKPFGCLSIGKQQANAYGLHELELLEQLAPQVAVAIEKALLIDVMERRTTELRLLNRFGEMLFSTTDFSLIFDSTLNMLPRLLPGDVQGVVIASEEVIYAGAAVPFEFQQTDKMMNHILKTFFELNAGQFSTGRITIKTIAGNMPVSGDWAPEHVLSLPILTRRGAQGTIYIASGKEKTFSDNLLHIFSLVVSQISTVIENAQLYQQAEQERARLAAILASSTDAVLVVDRDGRIVLDNPAAWEVIGVQESQRGRKLADTTPVTDLVELFSSAMQGGKLTGEILLEDGRTFFANLSPVSAGEAEIIGWIATMQDVSHFKELNELKNDFVNTVSHDLRSPLSMILMAASTIPDLGTINVDQQRLLDLISGRVEGMGELIDDLLDVGKIEAGIDMEMTSCNLAALIEDILGSLMPQTVLKDIQVNSELSPDLPPITANQLRLRQVIYNLVNNALKYTPAGGLVTIKAYRHSNDEVRLQFVDTGIGIPASDQPHVFEKFYRVRGDQALKIKGSGLGLAIVKSIVERHHGRVWLESVFGEGSTFTVALPIHQEDRLLQFSPDGP